MRRLLCVVALVCIVASVGAADIIKGDISPLPVERITITKISGLTPVSSLMASKATVLEKESVLTTATKNTLALRKYPYTIATETKVLKFRCDATACWYWIAATRGGKEVRTNSPVILYNPPAFVVDSYILDEKANTEQITIRESPSEAVDGILKQYVDGCPLGKAVTGMKE